MSDEAPKWRKMKNKESDIKAAQMFLRENENNNVSACGRFLALDETKGSVWMLTGKDANLSMNANLSKNANPQALFVYSRKTLIPVFCGKKEIPYPDFLKELVKKNKIHSVQGQKQDVLVLEDMLKQAGSQAIDFYDYDLMSLDNQPDKKSFSSGPVNLILRTPRLVDLDGAAPLQAAYEKTEVLPSGSDFSPASSRLNLANIIAKGNILCAEINGRLVGKINVNAVSFTRYQVGGIFVHPDFRRLGIARRMTAEFISPLIKSGKGITLFVKKANLQAQRLYSSLGFTAFGEYRISYY